MNKNYFMIKDIVVVSDFEGNISIRNNNSNIDEILSKENTITKIDEEKKLTEKHLSSLNKGIKAASYFTFGFVAYTTIGYFASNNFNTHLFKHFDPEQAIIMTISIGGMLLYTSYVCKKEIARKNTKIELLKNELLNLKECLNKLNDTSVAARKKSDVVSIVDDNYSDELISNINSYAHDSDFKILRKKTTF